MRRIYVEPVASTNGTEKTLTDIIKVSQGMIMSNKYVNFHKSIYY